MRKMVFYLRLALQTAVGRLQKAMLGNNIVSVITRSANGIFAVDIEDRGVGKELRHNGEYGQDELERIFQYAGADDRVLVVGAHLGALVVPIAKHCKSVVAIEANPDTFGLLKTNLMLNDVANVSAHNIAASDKTEQLINGIFYVMRAGCPWRLLPSGFAAVEHDLSLVCDVPRRESLREDQRRAGHARSRTGRPPSQSTGAIIDSESIKTTEAGGPRGYDAGKKINGRKRHALVDTDGRGLVLEPHSASIQDRDGGGPLLQASRRIFPFIERVSPTAGMRVRRSPRH